MDRNCLKLKELAESLGYMVKRNGRNLYDVLDKDDKPVGRIKSFEVEYFNGRKEITGHELDLNLDGFHLELTLGKSTDVIVNCVDYGHMACKISEYGLQFNFESETDKYDIVEGVMYRNTSDPLDKKEYSYNITYKNKKTGQKVRRFLGGKNLGYISGEDGKLSVIERTMLGKRTIKDDVSKVEGTIEEMALKHELGIESFNCFRVILNKALPFEEDVIPLIFTDEEVKRLGLSIFYTKEDPKIMKLEDYR